MAQYTLAKLDVTARTPACYAWSHEYDNWADLVADLAWREREANECFYGRGSHILRDGEMIGNVTLFAGGDLNDVSTGRVTLAQFRAAAAAATEPSDEEEEFP